MILHCLCYNGSLFAILINPSYGMDLRDRLTLLGFAFNTKTLGFTVKKFLTPFGATHVSIINSDYLHTS